MTRERPGAQTSGASVAAPKSPGGSPGIASSRSEKPRVLFLPWDERHNASARCRIFDVAEWLARNGWDVTVRPPLGGTLGAFLGRPGAARRVRRSLYRALQAGTRIVTTRSARHRPIVVLQRELFPFGPPWLEQTLLSSHAKVVFDLDDALHVRPVHHAASTHGLHDFGKAERIARQASAVVVSSASLESWARQFNQHVVQIPTAVDTRRFRPFPQKGEGRENLPIVGWTGTAGNYAHLASIRPALEAVAREVPFVLRIVGETAFEPWNSPRTEFIPWTLEGEAGEVARFDVGLMPLVDSEYARAKAGYKALVYMACGVPPVISPVGTNLEILDDGIEGFFASSLEEWKDRILRLLRDGELRARLGGAARDRVVAERSQQALFPRWAQLLRSLGSEPHGD